MMKMRSLISAAAIIVTVGCAMNVLGQKKSRLGRVCGNPNLPCKARENFQPFELPFETGKDFVIAESEPFYAIVLKSAKDATFATCEKAFPEEERLPIQELFPDHKVFALRCLEPGMNFYTNVAQDAAFVAVYAGKTPVEANKFLKTVKATNKFPGIKARKMQIGINGT